MASSQPLSSPPPTISGQALVGPTSTPALGPAPGQVVAASPEYKTVCGVSFHTRDMLAIAYVVLLVFVFAFVLALSQGSAEGSKAALIGVAMSFLFIGYILSR